MRRLLLCYPRDWRDRYGDEFAELLAAEQAEQGPSWPRVVNVAATGLRARLAEPAWPGTRCIRRPRPARASRRSRPALPRPDWSAR